MPAIIKNPEGWTLRKLVQNTYHHMRSRYTYMRRDVLKTVTVKEVSVYDGKEPGQARTKYIIQSSSYPQYYPYYTKKDSRGRSRSFQRTYKHQYDVTIQLDYLSLDTDRIKLRTGSDSPWDFGEAGKSKKDSKGRVKEGTNIKRGRNGDFFFRLSWLYKDKGILFGRNWAKGPPNKTNPKHILFLDKHMLRTIEFLVNKGILK